MKLEFQGWDNWDRPVYKDESDKLWKDVDPRRDHKPDLCTSNNNDFHGEPDTPMHKLHKDVAIEFIPKRITW